MIHNRQSICSRIKNIMRGCTSQGTDKARAWAKKATARVIGAALLGALLSTVPLSVPHEAQAQGGAVARVASVQRKVEKRGRATPWREVGAGASLGIGEGLRTGKRSKVDMKFADGSVLRLGQLSSIEIQSAKGARLIGGQVLFSQLRPGRILAGSAAAEIRGSTGTVELAPDGTVTGTLFSGAMDISSGGQTVSLTPGTQSTVPVGGVPSPPQPISAPGGGGSAGGDEDGGDSDILDEPEPGPFVGGALNKSSFAAANQTVAQSTSTTVADDSGFPGASPGTPSSPSPFPTAFPTVPPGQDLIGVRPRVSGYFDTRSGSPSALKPPSTRFWSTPSFALPLFQASPRYAQFAPPVQAQEIQLVVPAPNTPDALDAPDAASSTSLGADATLDVAQNDLRIDLDTSKALAHLEESLKKSGRSLGGDASLITALSDSGNAAYGARIRGFGSIGKVYFQATLLPLRLRSEGGTRDYSSIADAFVLLRDDRGQIQIGRQRFVSGPTQSSLFGSLVRQGGRDTMDAIRIAPRLKNGVQLEAAYIYDAFPRNLPFQISGAQHALYGRAALRRPTFSTGLNLFKYSDEGTTGATVDFAVPLAQKQIEFYGEVGRDPFRRTLTTFGLAFPGLYEKTNFDAFLEYARLHRRSGAGATSSAAPPSEVTLRVYKSVGNNLNTVAALSRFGNGEGYNFTLGISLGARVGSQAGRGIGQ
jgi:hypothetical protein